MRNFFKRHPKLLIVVVNIVLLFGLLFLVELYLSFSKPEPEVHVENDGIHRAISLREGRPHLSATFVPGGYWEGISDNLEFKTYRTRFDEDGFLMPSKVFENPDRKIFFLGGSTTYCEYVDEETRFPVLAARLISEKTGLKVNGYNGGMSFNNSLHSINTLINKVIPHSPDVVVMMHAVNDAFTLSVYETYWDPNSQNVANLIEMPKPASGARAIVRGFRDIAFPNLYQVVQKAVSNLKQGDSGPAIAEEDLGHQFKGEKFYTEKFRRNLCLFVAICRESGIEPVLMTQANRLTESPDTAVANYIRFLQGVGEYGNPAGRGHYLPLTYGQYAALEHAFNETIRQVGAEKNVLVIDLEKSVPPSKEFMYDPFHYTGKGSELIAEIIAGKLSPLLTQTPTDTVFATQPATNGN